MEKIVGGTLFNTNRDTKIVNVQGIVLFITASANFYLYYLDGGQVVPQQLYEAKEWIKNKFHSFTQPEIERIKRFVQFNESDNDNY